MSADELTSILIPNWSYSIENAIFGGIFLIMAILGFYLSCVIRRPAIFRFKLAIVFIIPLFLAFSFFANTYPLHRDYIILALIAFICLTSILYYREVKEILTSEGFHKAVLGTCLKTINDSVMTRDFCGRITYMNNSMKGLLGLKEDEKVFGKYLLDIVQSQRMKGFTIDLYKVCEKIGCKNSEIPCKFYEYGEINGEYHVLSVTHSNILTPANKNIGTISIVRRLNLDPIKNKEIYHVLSCNSLKDAYSLMEKRNLSVCTCTCCSRLIDDSGEKIVS